MDGVDSGFDRTSTGNDILLYTDTDNDNIVLGRDEMTDEIVFAIYLTEPAGDPLESSIWVVEYDAIEHDGADQLNDGDGNDHDASYDLANLVYVTAFESQEFSFAGAPPGSNLFMWFGDLDQSIIVTGRDPANQSEGENISSGDTVNTSGNTDTSLGTNGQQVKAGEGLYFTFASGSTSSTPDDYIVPNLSQTEADVEANITPLALTDARGASVTVSQVNPGGNTTVSMRITAYTTDLETGVNFLDGLGDADDVPVLITGVTINGTSVSFTTDGDGVIVSGVKAGDVVGYTTVADHQRVLIENAQPESGKGSNVSFDLGGFALTEVAGDTDEIGSKISFYDDGPGDPTVALSGDDPVGLTFDGGLQPDGNFTGAESSDDTNASPTIAVVDFSDAFTIGNLNDFGADGAGESVVSYALQLAVAEGTASGLTSDGDPIRLYINDDGTLVTGSTAGDEASVAAGNTVFTLALDTTTGVLTQTQSAVIDHGTTDTYEGAYIVDERALANGLVELVASAETTDGDHDVSNVVSSTLDLGGNVRFGDDGPADPTVALSGAEPVGLTFDGGLTDGNFTGTESGDDTSTSTPLVAVVDFSTAFTIGIQDDFGADGGDSTVVSYALQLATGVAEGDPSGLTSGGDPIRLYINDDGTLVTGSTDTSEGAGDGFTVFTLALNATTGVLTQTQSAVIDHGTTDEYEGAYIVDVRELANGLVELVASAETTDSEGDTSGVNSEALDLGGNVRFGDDGPADPTVALSGAEPVGLTFDGGLTDGNFTGTESGDDTSTSTPLVAVVDFSTAFTIGIQDDFGADGGDSTVVSYALQLATGVAEGDPSGLTSGGDPIRLYINDDGTLVTGSTDTSEGAGDGFTVFTLALNATTGVLTQTQSAVIDHGTTDEYEGAYIVDVRELANGLVELVASAETTDSEGDTSGVNSEALDLGGNVRFGDDGPADPTVALSGAEPVGLTFDGGLTDGNFTGTESGDDTSTSTPLVAVVDFSTAFTIGIQDDFGADGGDSTVVSYALQLATGVAEGDPSGLTSGGDPIRLYINDDGTLVTGSTDTSEGAGDGFTVFTLALNATTGVLTQTQSAVIDHGTTDEYEGAYIVDVRELANGLVELVASAETTDSEGDTSGVNSEALDLGGNVRFGDDGPADPTVALSGAEPVGLTFDGGLTDGNFTGTESGDDTSTSTPLVAVVDFSTAFTIGIQDDFGADGGDSTVVSYALQLATGVAEGDPSGLTSGGDPIRLYINDDGTLVTGSTDTSEGAGDGFTVFTLALNATTGVLTQTQSAVIDHGTTDEYEGAYIVDVRELANGLVELVASAETTDSEGDTSGVNSEALDLGGNVRFGDDGPADPTVALSGAEPVGLTFDGGLTDGNFTGTESGDDTSTSTPLVAVVDFSTAFTIGIQDDFGADGGDSTVVSYALQLATGVAEGDPSGLTSGGDPIRLYINDDGTLVTGSTDTSEGAGDGFTVFTLALNATTGVLTQTQSAVIDHGTTDEYEGAYIVDVRELANGLVELVASAETTDSEGDTSGVNSEALDLGGNVRFGDDGPADPTVALSGAEPVGLTFDGGLTDGNFTGTESGDDTSTSTPLVAVVDFSTAFTIGIQDDFGADGGDSTVVSYALQLATGVAEGDPSGLTSGGDPIRLYINDDGTLVTGSTDTSEGAGDGFTVFTLALNATTGVLTQTQSAVIDHGTTDEYEGAYIVDVRELANGLVELVASAETTDSEGDTSGVNSEALDLGGNVRFGDDGPADPTVALSGAEPVGLTFDGGLTDGNFTGTESGDDTSTSTPLVAVVDFSTAFTIGIQDDFGADGGDSTVVSYALQLATGVAEGDPSGLTSGGDPIRLYINDDGTLVTGSTDTSEGAGDGFTVFTLALNATTGVLTQTQSAVIDHGTTDEYEGAYIVDVRELANGLVELVASAETTDSEGDTSGVNSEALDLGGNVRFGDDGPADPTVALSGAEPVGLTFDGGLTDGNFTGTESGDDTSTSTPLVAVVDFSTAFTIGIQDDFGADGGDSTVVSYALQLATGVAEGDPSGLTSGGDPIRLYINDDGTLVTGSTDTSEGAGDGFTVFTLALNATTGVLTQTQSAVIDHGTTDEYEGAYIVDVRELANGLVELVASAETTDSEGDTSGVNSEALDLGGNVRFGDDGPAVTVNDASGTYQAGADGTWSDLPGADGFDSLNVTFDSFEIDANGTQTTSTTNSTFARTGNLSWAGSVTGDFTDDGVINEQTVDFSLTFDPVADTYSIVIDDLPTSTSTFDTSQGTLKAGGPDEVRTLLFGGEPPTDAGNDDIVFFGAVPTAVRSDPAEPVDIDSILDLVVRGELDLTEEEIEALLPLPDLVNPGTQMNVSTAGIGINNNNLDGADEGDGTGAFAGTTITSGDESFVVNPETLVDSVTVYISSTVQGYDTATEDLYYTVYYADGSVSGPILVEELDLTHYANNDTSVPKEAKGGSSFTIESGENQVNQIDAVQFTMGLGTVKIPIISFDVETEFEPEPLAMDFTATLEDGDNDTATDDFTVNLL
ncbi:hypothetical protein BOX17_03680 [Halomonas aestuarii]|uniref:DUF5801 domain-containing protein n=1 Tax=Halomonas aestuarii TaxID=1897729 RepID=A0A1J0VDT0_9GAMM|nr:hypothetical protein BOX17_03680 [Halomonas aestuarii]